ncbi:hypothetical protein WJX81_004579 [Elliptochloris bilobata]|uniref:Uncharacterized protein n=1 Tax=Elliptochloris bilobata TaxID=381761 RepID=A0AAW1SD14_9CHLO
MFNTQMLRSVLLALALTAATGASVALSPEAVLTAGAPAAPPYAAAGGCADCDRPSERSGHACARCQQGYKLTEGGACEPAAPAPQPDFEDHRLSNAMLLPVGPPSPDPRAYLYPPSNPAEVPNPEDVAPAPTLNEGGDAVNEEPRAEAALPRDDGDAMWATQGNAAQEDGSDAIMVTQADAAAQAGADGPTAESGVG